MHTNYFDQLARIGRHNFFLNRICVGIKIFARKTPREYIFMWFTICDEKFDRAIQPCGQTKGLKFRQKNDGFINLDVQVIANGSLAWGRLCLSVTAMVRVQTCLG